MGVPSRALPSPLSSSTLDSITQRVDSIFPAFQTTLYSLKSNLLAMNPQMSPLISLINSNLDALEALIVSRL